MFDRKLFNRLSISASIVAALLVLGGLGTLLAYNSPQDEATGSHVPGSVALQSEELTDIFCTIAQWQTANLLTTYDVMVRTQQQAQDLAGDLSVVLTFEFLDIEALRQRMLDAQNAVCSSANPGEAKAALKDLKAIKESNSEELKGQRDIFQPAIEAAKAGLKEQVKAQMGPIVDEAKARTKQDVGAERRRLLSEQSGELEEGERPSLTAEQEQLLETFKESLKVELQSELKAKASELAGPDRDLLNAVGQLFKGQKNEISALVEAYKADKDNFLAQVREQQKAAILRNVDERIEKARQRFEGEGGGESFLATITAARLALDSAVTQALAGREPGAVRTAIEAFWTAWAEATCSNVTEKFRNLSDKSATVLDNLQGADVLTVRMQTALDAFTALQDSLQTVDQICQQLNADTLKLLRTVFEEVQAAAPAAKKALEVLKTQRESNQQPSEGG